MDIVAESEDVTKHYKYSAKWFLNAFRNKRSRRTVDPGVAGSSPVGLAFDARCQSLATGFFFGLLQRVSQSVATPQVWLQSFEAL